MKYEDLTPEQKAKICNGCGGKGSWVKPPHRIFFKASCNHHDFGYWKGCTAADRLNCDKKLYAAMVDDCASLPWYQYLRYRPWCFAYYWAVRAWGGKYFYYGPVQRAVV